MNEVNKKFLEKNGISIEDISSKVDCHIYTREEVNPIIANYGFESKSETDMISIRDIVGYDRTFEGSNSNIFLSMDRFFNENGKTYTTRSLGMLEYDKDNILENLKQSFVKEPVSLLETGEGTYTIMYNGMHRFTLLRILYLTEVANANGNREKIEELDRKYTIPADITLIDLDKTYCRYLLTKIKAENDPWRVVSIISEIDSSYKATGNAVVRYENGQTEVLNNAELISLTRDRIIDDKEFELNIPELENFYKKYKSFAMFLDEEFADILPINIKDIEQKGIDDND